LAQLKSERKVGFYTCGRCKGSIRFLLTEGKPDVCSECGYGHGERDVNDIPAEINLNLGSVNEQDSGSYGANEQTTIVSR
jgi:hypothetical protein